MLLRHETKVAELSNNLREEAMSGAVSNDTLLTRLSKLHHIIRDTYGSADDRHYMCVTYVHPCSSLIRPI